MPQRSIATVYMRGGTSRALIFHARDLPLIGADGDTAARDAIFCAAIGSPDPYGRQLNGVGGGVTSLSKVAIVGPPTHPQADIDYTFGQVDVTQPSVGYRGNCGNISSAIGPFAVDEGLVSAADGRARVTIHNTNTGKLIRSTFPVSEGKAVSQGDFAIDGVAGTGAMIELAFLDPGGATTGRLLPTGRTCDWLDVPGLGRIKVSIVDAANPVVFVAAASLGLRGDETPAALADRADVMAQLRALRAQASVAAGLIAVPDEARTLLRSLPLVAIISSAPDRSDVAAITVRMISSDQPHGASPLTGAMCLAIAAQLDGSIVADTITRPPVNGRVLLHHASGTLSVAARLSLQDGVAVAHEAIVHRTARRLMDGRVYIP